MRWLVLVSLLVSATAHAERPIPSADWTPEAHAWLSRAQVAEAGWTATVDHDVIAWALQRRWLALRVKYPTTSFSAAVRSYCAGLGEASHTPRQRWVRALRLDLLVPDGWPSRLSWTAHQGRWAAVLARAARWASGAVRDPSGGRADHWGGTRLEADTRRAARAVAAGRWRALDIPGTDLANGKRANAYFEIL